LEANVRRKPVAWNIFQLYGWYVDFSLVCGINDFTASLIDTTETQTIQDFSAKTEKFPVILTHDNYLMY